MAGRDRWTGCLDQDHIRTDEVFWTEMERTAEPEEPSYGENEPQQKISGSLNGLCYQSQSEQFCPHVEIRESFETDLSSEEHFRDPKGTFEWTSGSKYLGQWDQLGMAGEGQYYMPHGVIYEGDLQDGMFHGSGVLHYPNGVQMQGVWCHGRVVEIKYVFKDRLQFDDRGWFYCKSPDRRFFSELVSGLRPAGRSYLTNDEPPRRIPPQCYDTADGFYYTNIKCVKHPRGRILRVPTDGEQGWILKHCRKAWDQQVGYRRDLYENWFGKQPAESQPRSWLKEREDLDRWPHEKVNLGDPEAADGARAFTWSHWETYLRKHGGNIRGRPFNTVQTDAQANHFMNYAAELKKQSEIATINVNAALRKGGSFSGHSVHTRFLLESLCRNMCCEKSQEPLSFVTIDSRSFKEVEQIILAMVHDENSPIRIAQSEQSRQHNLQPTVQCKPSNLETIVEHGPVDLKPAEESKPVGPVNLGPAEVDSRRLMGIQVEVAEPVNSMIA